MSEKNKERIAELTEVLVWVKKRVDMLEASVRNPRNPRALPRLRRALKTSTEYRNWLEKELSKAKTEGVENED